MDSITVVVLASFLAGVTLTLIARWLIEASQARGMYRRLDEVRESRKQRQDLIASVLSKYDRLESQAEQIRKRTQQAAKDTERRLALPGPDD